MKAIVRDDIISLNAFVSAEFKYKKYLEILRMAGNYCFLDQFKNLVDGYQAILKGLIENNLILTENVNRNYKYIYLTDTAMKYLYLRNSVEDFSDVKKNKISVQKVNKHPTEKQLFVSAYKFHLLIDKKSIDKESILNELENYIYLKEHDLNKCDFENWRNEQIGAFSSKKNELETIHKKTTYCKSLIININSDIYKTDIDIEELHSLENEKKNIKIEIENSKKKFLKSGLHELDFKLKETDLQINELKKKILLKNNTIKKHNDFFNNKENECKKFKLTIDTLEKKFNETLEKEKLTIKKLEESKKIFINLYDKSKVIARIKENSLEFFIFDIGTFKTSWGYIKLINKIEDLKLGYINIKIIIYSYAEHRALNLNKEFIALQKKKEQAQKTLQNYNARINQYDTGERPDFYINANKIYDSIPDFKVEIKQDFYYMSAYKEFVTRGERTIKKKDKKVIDDIIKKLKND